MLICFLKELRNGKLLLITVILMVILQPFCGRFELSPLKLQSQVLTDNPMNLFVDDVAFLFHFADSI